MNTYENIVKELEQAAKMCVHRINGSQNLAVNKLIQKVKTDKGFEKMSDALTYMYSDYETKAAAHKLGNAAGVSFGLYINLELDKLFIK